MTGEAYLSNSQPRTQHFGDNGYSPIRQAEIAAIGPEEEEYVSDNCVCAKDDCDDCNPGESEAYGRPNQVFHDAIKVNAITSCKDTMAACWNGWEAACKFEDPYLAQYYLDLLTLTQQYQKKMLALKKKNN